MHRFACVGKLTALSLLIFANSVLLYAQPDSIYRLPAGTRITLRLDAEINSKVSSVNDTFLATIAKPVKVREAVVLPMGTVVEGRVKAVKTAAGGSRGGSLDVVFETIKFPSETRRIEGLMIKPLAARSSNALTALSILGAAVAGAAIGAATRTSAGALIGGAAGAGAGGTVALLRKGKDVRLRKDEEFEIELKKEVMLPVLDY
ncbi:MAG: hypothetical protein ABL999_01570 [Pyrinomonadaceae bacterium]